MLKGFRVGKTNINKRLAGLVTSHWGALDPLTEILITPPSLTQEIFTILSVYTVA